MCNSELRSFQRRLSDFEAQGIRVVAISADDADANRRNAQRLGLTFPMLSDSNLEVIKRYDVLHAGGGPRGENIARPAEFLIDSSGTIRWVNLTESTIIRARPEQVLKAFNELVN